MRKVSFVLVLCLLCALFCGCISVQTGKASTKGSLYIVCTASPQYDFIKNIAGDRVTIEMLVPEGTDTHNFGLKDISISKLNRLADADLVVYVGGESDEKLITELRSVLTEKTSFVSLLSMIEEPLFAANSGDHSHDDGHDHTSLYDEHVWTSPKRAMVLVETLAEQLGSMDQEGKERYQKAAKAYIEKLRVLDEKLENVIDGAKHDTLILADRHPFRYFCHDYRLLAEAAFAGCSSEVEPSLAVLDALYERAKTLNLPAILYMEGSNPAYAQSIAEKLGCKALMLHSCHVFEEDESYLALMEKNITVLITALDAKIGE